MPPRTSRVAISQSRGSSAMGNSGLASSQTSGMKGAEGEPVKGACQTRMGPRLSRVMNDAPGILPRQSIHALIAGGAIDAQGGLDADQAQPASLDLRLGRRAWRVR